MSQVLAFTDFNATNTGLEDGPCTISAVFRSGDVRKDNDLSAEIVEGDLAFSSYFFFDQPPEDWTLELTIANSSGTLDLEFKGQSVPQERLMAFEADDLKATIAVDIQENTAASGSRSDNTAASHESQRDASGPSKEGVVVKSPNVTIKFSELTGTDIAGFMTLGGIIAGTKVQTQKMEVISGHTVTDIGNSQFLIYVDWEKFQKEDGFVDIELKMREQTVGQGVLNMGLVFKEPSCKITLDCQLNEAFSKREKNIGSCKIFIQAWDKSRLAMRVAASGKKVDEFLFKNVDIIRNEHLRLIEDIKDLNNRFTHNVDVEESMTLVVEIEEMTNQLLQLSSGDMAASDEESESIICEEIGEDGETHEVHKHKFDFRKKAMVWYALAMNEVNRTSHNLEVTRQAYAQYIRTRPVVKAKIEQAKECIVTECYGFATSAHCVALRALSLSEQESADMVEGAKQNYHFTLESCKQARRMLMSAIRLSDKSPSRKEKNLLFIQKIADARKAIVLSKILDPKIDMPNLAAVRKSLTPWSADGANRDLTLSAENTDLFST